MVYGYLNKLNLIHLLYLTTELVIMLFLECFWTVSDLSTLVCPVSQVQALSYPCGISQTRRLSFNQYIMGFIWYTNSTTVNQLSDLNILVFFTILCFQVNSYIYLIIFWIQCFIVYHVTCNFIMLTWPWFPDLEITLLPVSIPLYTM